MGVEVKRDKLTRGIPKLTKDRIFPGWDETNINQFVYINPERCDKDIFIRLDAKYTALATRNSDLDAIRGLIEALIPVATSAGPNVTAIINGASAGLNTIQSLLGRMSVPYNIELKVPVELCSSASAGATAATQPSPEVISTTLTVKARAARSDPDDAEDRAELTLDLAIEGDHRKAQHIFRRFDTSQPDIIVVNDLHYADKNFDAMATISILSLVTGFSITQGYSSVTVESIEFNIKSVGRERWLTHLPAPFLAWMRNEGIELPEPPATSGTTSGQPPH